MGKQSTEPTKESRPTWGTLEDWMRGQVQRDNTIESKSGQCKMKVDNPTIVILMNTYPAYAKSRICTH